MIHYIYSTYLYKNNLPNNGGRIAPAYKDKTRTCTTATAILLHSYINQYITLGLLEILINYQVFLMVDSSRRGQ